MLYTSFVNKMADFNIQQGIYIVKLIIVLVKFMVLLGFGNGC